MRFGEIGDAPAERDGLTQFGRQFGVTFPPSLLFAAKA